MLSLPLARSLFAPPPPASPRACSSSSLVNVDIFLVKYNLTVWLRPCARKHTAQNRAQNRAQHTAHMTEMLCSIPDQETSIIIVSSSPGSTENTTHYARNARVYVSHTLLFDDEDKTCSMFMLFALFTDPWCIEIRCCCCCCSPDTHKTIRTKRNIAHSHSISKMCKCERELRMQRTLRNGA